ncbi:hypothetical protein [Haloprofundus halobius]|uniref:hypothetical protein n=1 Tax=Haloprofundus halobius TaxID=2876194 RepID=UPI001CCFB7FA|nr:hypothetical protein [Haloprofundus halobius]
MRRLVLVVCLAALLTGCSALPFDSPPPSDDRAVAAVEEVNSTVSSVETYRFDTDIRVSASDGGRSRTVTADGSGAVDLTAKRMRATSEVADETLDSYVTEYKSYQECPEPWEGYAVENVSQSEPWATATPLHRQIELFEHSNVYWRGNRTVDGERTVLVVAHPSDDTVQSLADRRRTGSAELDGGSFDNATARLWIDPETNRPVEFALHLELSRRGATATADLTTRYTEYGESVDVSVPSAVYETQYQLGCPGS